MFNLQEDMYEQLKEKKGSYCIFNEWRSNTWADPCNG